jgi:ATP-binding cassette subfamily B protein
MTNNNLLPQNLYSFILHFLKPYKITSVVFVCFGLMAGFWGPFNSMLIKHIVNLMSYSRLDDISSLACPVALLVLNFRAPLITQ